MMSKKEIYRMHATDALKRMKENESGTEEILNIKEKDPPLFDYDLDYDLAKELIKHFDYDRAKELIKHNDTVTNTPKHHDSEVALIMGLITDAKSQLDNVDNELDINQLSIVKNDLPIYTSDFSEIKYKLAIIGTCLDSVYWFIYNNMKKPNAVEVKFETVRGNQLISDHGEKIDEYVKNHIIYPPTNSEENLPGNVNRKDLIKELNELRDSVFRVIGYIDDCHDLIYDTLVSEENEDHVKFNTRIFELWEINEHCNYIKKMMNEMIDKYNKLDGND